MTDPLLDVRDLRVTIPTEDGDVHAVSGVSFAVEPGKVLGVVGESGSGKSVTMLSLMGLMRRAGARVTGEVRFGGTDLVTADDRTLRRLRGDDVAMIFQDPLSSLHPFYRVGSQITEGIRAHRDVSRKQAKERAIELLGLVGIPRPHQRVDDYPHEFSGGMRQRVMIAMALANDPKLLIADEPTTALDVTVQAQILALLQRLQAELGMAVVMITHDLGVVAEIADDIAVMYAGRIVERAPVKTLFRQPRHPYTWGLLRSIPRLDLPRDVDLVPIEGRPPSLIHPTGRCAFQPRCAYAARCCGTEDPALTPVGSDPEHLVRCDMDEEQGTRIWSALAAGESPEQAALAAGVPTTGTAA
ncbi:ABC transporter ATP-binding protein [Patulibacter minatonensis]|uniref:ABC transporter ATP-binding protein n=1 Tax=Patulibacter minatonensis TaxID=298163 RepID=UPI00047B5BE9|nr:ABC transporter ATP-binding protein [Patulibacter minatonensis]